MCWQDVSLKDPASQELLEAVERERRFRVTPSRNSAVFHHTTLGEFELQHLPVGASDSELEERIIQHLAAAAAMGRAHQIGRREGQRIRSSAHGRPQFLVFSSHPNAPESGSVPSSLVQVEGQTEPAAINVVTPSTPLSSGRDESVQHISRTRSSRTFHSASGSSSMPTNRRGLSLNNHRNISGPSSPTNQDGAGSSDFHSFSESLKSRFNAVSMRYRDSISKSARGWKERFFSRTSMSDISSEVRREVNAGIASVSCMMERLGSRENNRPGQASLSSDHSTNCPVTEENQQNNAVGRRVDSLDESNIRPPPYVPSAGSIPS